MTPKSDETSVSHELKPQIGAYAATAIVIGAVIGSGIFISSPGMARNSESGLVLLAIWAIAGFFTFVGALTQCELCSQFPQTGGTYLYLKEVYGSFMGFLYGWANFMIAGSGATAALAFIFAGYFGELVPLPTAPEAWQAIALPIPGLGRLFPFVNMGEKGLGILLLIGLTALNVRGVRFSASLQSISTTTKVLALSAIIVCGLCWPGGSFEHITASRSTPLTMSTLQSLALAITALSGAFWAYDGWANVTFITGEIKNPARNMPLALLGGTFLITMLYLLANIAYLRVFSIEDLGAVPGDLAASALMNKVLGAPGAKAVAILILLSTFDTMNSTVLTTPRVYYSMAKNGLFPAAAGRLHPKYATPSTALWMQCAWSIVLLLTGSFELVTSMYVWVNWLFYFLIACAVFICRKRGLPRTFSTWGYPYLPALFACFSLFYLSTTLWEDIVAYQNGTSATIKSLMGVLLVLTGVPLYGWFSRTRRRVYS